MKMCKIASNERTRRAAEDAQPSAHALASLPPRTDPFPSRQVDSVGFASPLSLRAGGERALGTVSVSPLAVNGSGLCLWAHSPL
jgi:hypothetical protein